MNSLSQHKNNKQILFRTGGWGCARGKKISDVRAYFERGEEESWKKLEEG